MFMKIPVLAATTDGPFITYSPNAVANTDEELLHTYASFSSDLGQDFASNRVQVGSWALCVEVPIPPLQNPTLRRVEYMLAYATTNETGNSLIQTDTLLTAQVLPPRVITTGPSASLAVYTNENITVPAMTRPDLALRLSNVLAVKSNGGGDGWSHFVDNRAVDSAIRVGDDGSHLYLVFNVNEYPTHKTVRSLCIKVSATWQKMKVEENAKQAALIKATIEDNISDDADEEMMTRIKEIAERLGPDRLCPNKLPYKQTPYGYVCNGGTHNITWEELGISQD